MTTFTIPQFVAVLGGLGAAMETANHEALEKAAKIIETEAKRVIGTYDYGWTPLKPATIAQKTTGDSPLLETGEMRDSIEHNADHKEAHIGSDNDKAVWHELGTSTVPARSFLVGAAVHKETEVVEKIGRTVVTKLISG